MSQNKTAKYFKYAIGEIILVVIGILIALQINNWNTEHNNRNKEALLLKQIHRDFASNKIQFDSIMSFNNKMESALQLLLKTMAQSNDTLVIDTLFKYGDTIVPVKTFNPANGTVEALIYSSSIELISDDSLRDLLVSWKDIYTDYREEEQFAHNFQTQHLLPYFRKQFNYIQPYSKSNLDMVKSIEFQNIWLDKLRYVQMIKTAAQEEKVGLYINEILRLTGNYD